MKYCCESFKVGIEDSFENQGLVLMVIPPDPDVSDSPSFRMGYRGFGRSQTDLILKLFKDNKINNISINKKLIPEEEIWY